MLVDEQGQRHDLLQIGPKGVANLLERAWHTKLAQEASKKMGLPQDERVDFHHARQRIQQQPREKVHGFILQPDDGRADGHEAACKCSRCEAPEKREEMEKVRRRQRGILRNFLADGIWDKPRLREAGYLLDNLRCDLCDHEDSLQHRLWGCKATESLRKELIGDKYLAWLHSVSDDPREAVRIKLAKKGLCRYPANGQPRPATEGSAHKGNTARMLSAERVAIDGHCTCEFHPALNRASWSIVGLDPDENEPLEVTGPVWASLPQTGAAAERVAMTAVHQVTDQNWDHLPDQQVTVVVDNLGAMAMITKPATWANLRFSGYAGLQRELRATRAFREAKIGARHCTSHQDSKLTAAQRMAQSEDAKKDRAANERADIACEEARQQHPHLDKELMNKDAHAREVAMAVLKYAVAALDLYPENERHLRAKPKERSTAKPSLQISHRWVETPVNKAMRWRCQVCWRWAATNQSDGTQCKGPPASFRETAVAAAAAGHQVVHLRPKNNDMPSLLVCATCGAMATQGSKVWTNLRAVCARGANAHNNSASLLKRAWRGQYPKRGRFGDDILYHEPAGA